jgi:hypothetical protein
MEYSSVRSLRKDRRAVSPAISMVIMTAAVMVMILVAMAYANNFLGSRLAENEFSTNKQFMRSTALQIDDIAWTIGRTQTVRYSSQYGNMKFQNSTVTYTVRVDRGSGVFDTNPLVTVTTGIIMFNMPVNSYSVTNNYFERVLPSYGNSFLQVGPTAPVSQVFCVENLPMTDGNYIRVVAVPSVRRLDTKIAGSQGSSTNYTKFYMPSLIDRGTHPYLSQSITMTGRDVLKSLENGVDRVQITVSFPNATSGFDNDGFFRFDNVNEIVTLIPNSIVEFYIGTVVVTVGKV